MVTKGPHRYPPVGACVYCGATKYKEGVRKLSDEHIIPLAAHGDLVLPQASCFRCQKLTWKPEQVLLGLSAKAFRTLHNYKSRSKRPKTLPLEDVNGTGKSRDVPVEIYPNGFAMFFWPKPWKLTGATSNRWPMTKLWADLDRWNHCKDGLAKLGIRSWKSPDVSNEFIFRMFAKIGHSYLVAELGTGGFRPTLLDYIQRRSNEIMPWIGGTEQPETPTDDPYVIGWRPEAIDGTTYAVVTVRLFARQMGPTHLVVAGELPSAHSAASSSSSNSSK